MARDPRPRQPCSVFLVPVGVVDELPMHLLCLFPVDNLAQSSWCLLGSWMNFQCNCFAFSESNFCLQSGHWNCPLILMPTFTVVPSPDLAASLISIVSGMATAGRPGETVPLGEGARRQN